MNLLNRVFIPGTDHVMIIGDIHAVNEYGQHNGEVIPSSTHAKCSVISYKDKGTENIEDDLAKLRINHLDPGYEEQVGQSFWVAKNEFNHLRKISY